MQTNTPETALAWLKSVPAMYGKTPATEAYAKHADLLERLTKQHKNKPMAAAQLQRANLCELVANGDTPEDAVAMIFADPTPPPKRKTKGRKGNGVSSA